MSIKIEIEGDLAAFERDARGISVVIGKEAKKGADSYAKEIEGGSKRAGASATTAAKQAGSAWADVGRIMAGALSAQAIQGAAGALFDFASNVAESRIELARLQASTGASAELLAGLAVAADRTGGSFDAIGGSLNEFLKKASEASRGTGEARSAFESLGVALRDDVTGELRSSDEVLRATLTAYEQLPASLQKSEIGSKLFGGAVGDLNVALSAGALENWIDLAVESGAVVDEKAVASTEAWTQALSNLNGVLDKYAGASMDAFGPAAAGLIDDFALGLEFVAAASMQIGQEATAAIGRFAAVFSASMRGDVVGAAQAFQEYAVEGVGSSERVATAAFGAARAHVEARRALEGQTEAAREAAPAVQAVATATRASSSASSAAAAAARDAAAAERERGAAAVAMAKAIADAGADLVTREQRIADAARERRDAVAAALAAGVADQAAASAALVEIDAREARDRAALDEERVAQEQLLYEQRMERERRETEEIRAEWQRRRDVALDAARQITSAVTAGLREMEARRERAARDDLRRNESRVERLRDQEAALLEQLEAAEDEHTAFLIEQELARVQGQIASSEQQAAIRKREIERAARAQKAWAIASIVADAAAAVVKAMAILGPPPLSTAAIAAIGVKAGIQTALVASAEVPSYFRGTPRVQASGGAGLAPDETAALVLHDEEAVASRGGLEEVGRAMLDAGNRGARSELGGARGGDAAILLDGQVFGRWVARSMRSGSARGMFGSRGAQLIRRPR